VRESGGDSSRIYGTTGAVESESERKHGHAIWVGVVEQLLLNILATQKLKDK
jgi:hypothetical protein